MSQIIKKFHLSKGSQGNLSEIHILEQLLDHYVGTAINSRAVSDNPKFVLDPENPSRAYLPGLALQVPNNLNNTVTNTKVANFPYTFPLCFTS